MKTFGEVKVGDVMYSLNYKEFGVLTKHIVDEVKHNDKRCFIRIKGYYDADGNYPNNEKYDLVIIRPKHHTTGEVAPSIEGLKSYWIEDHNDIIAKLIEKLNTVSESIAVMQKDIAIINSIKE